MDRQLPAIRLRFAIDSLCFAAAVLHCVFTHCIPGVATAADWPTYRCDAARSGVGAESLPADLSLQWTYTPAHPPKPAWPAPSEEMPRMHADNAFHVALAGGRAYFGSSVTDEVCAIDMATGQVCWSFFTDGPVRFAPTVHEGRLYVGSDDGYVYCLNAADGSLIWRYRPGPSDEKVLGNGRMISLWPVRASVLVDQGVVYCGAGIFPYEGIYICALNTADGSVVVGYSINGAFIWDAAGGMQSLKKTLTNVYGIDLSGWYLIEATGISDDGSVIVGTGINPRGHTEAWRFVVPEPGTLSLMSLGLACVLGRKGKR